MIPPSAFVRKLRGKGAGELLRTAPEFALDRVERGAVDAYYRWKLHPTSTARNRRRQAAVKRLRSTDEILFLCHGNVCRSPFAERYARRRIDERGIEGLAVDSAGAVEMNDPRSPPNARSAADDYGVDLAGHRSVRATAEAVDAADLVLVMDYRNYRNYASRHPEAADRLFLLGVFGGRNSVQIDDPHGYDRSVFESVYADVAGAVDALLDEYERENRSDDSSELSVQS